MELNNKSNSIYLMYYNKQFNTRAILLVMGQSCNSGVEYVISDASVGTGRVNWIKNRMNVLESKVEYPHPWSPDTYQRALLQYESYKNKDIFIKQSEIELTDDIDAMNIIDLDRQNGPVYWFYDLNCYDRTKYNSRQDLLKQDIQTITRDTPYVFRTTTRDIRDGNTLLHNGYHRIQETQPECYPDNYPKY